ncbi:TetR/AcrR family transcriptional regulator [Klenkia brasiliensis]|uniref:Transcriptional regulator, TetR family n=1 Tax=Klenkia brasiliensis TaxID=333142 RepID=A0A1G7SAQ3_9ACTN|nr:TetR/AcrR family transcriptional regulator [Klenkia brasiliensis]SDG19260.1 transcriptional regulator, TetR family [Klenkia brasiliensis]
MSTPEVSLPRRERLEHDDRRDRIIAAAQQAFARSPYESVSIRELAEAAGTTRTNLHYYFRTKRDLYVEVVTRFAHLPLRLGPVENGSTGVAEVLSRWLDLVEENAETFRALLASQLHPGDPEVGGVLTDSLVAWEDRLLGLVELDPDDPSARAAIRSYQAMVSGSCDQWLNRRALTKPQVHALLCSCLLAVGSAVRATSP